MRSWFVSVTCILSLAGVLAPEVAAFAAEGGGTSIVVEPTSPEYEAERARAAAGAGGGKTPTGKAATSGGEGKQAKLERSFAEFCDGWAAKLRERQRDNAAKVQWQTGPDGRVVGEYVGYDTDHLGPASVSHADTTPIGRLTYQEVRLRRSGASKDEALASEPVVVERTEVTELFRHDGRGWVY